jgi:DNA-binding PucR family transcriptional regulator
VSSGSKPPRARPARSQPASSPESLLEPAHQRALELVGDRWTLWLLAAIDEGEGSRFSDLAGEPGLSRRVLTERLVSVVEAGLLHKEQYQVRPVRHRYRLTERGVAVRRASIALLHVASGGHLPVAVAAPQPVRTAQPQRPETHPADHLLEGDPQAARRVYDEAMAPLVRYDEQYRTPLVETLETYLACDASVGATAARLYAHRHTVRYRLGRVRELTGLDVDSLADRERLVLGLRALRILQRAGHELT